MLFMFLKIGMMIVSIALIVTWIAKARVLEQ